MERQSKTWQQLKDLVDRYQFVIRYEDNPDDYFISAIDVISQREYFCQILKESGSSDLAQWEGNYKAKADIPIKPLTEDGKEMVMSVSRPIGYNTFFTCAGDTQDEIGAGQEISWDFSNSENDIATPSGSGLKRKKIEFSFIDNVYLKEGSIYWQNAKKGSYIDIQVVCPAGYYYLKNDGTLTQAQQDTIIHKFANHHLFFGDCPMGDELNTEACSAEIPNYMKYQVIVTVPDSDTNSNGHISVELYRKRAVILE